MAAGARSEGLQLTELCLDKGKPAQVKERGVRSWEAL